MLSRTLATDRRSNNPYLWGSKFFLCFARSLLRHSSVFSCLLVHLCTVCVLQAAAGKSFMSSVSGLRGGFSFSTVTGVNTRRYHGLLIANPEPPLADTSNVRKRVPPGDRLHLLSCITGTIVVDGSHFPLGPNEQTSFERFPVPTFNYHAGGISIQRCVHLIDAENTVVVNYKLLEAPGGPKVELLLEPWVTFRSYHDVRVPGSCPQGTIDTCEGGLRYSCAEDGPELCLTYPTRGTLEASTQSARNETYTQEVHEFNQEVHEGVQSLAASTTMRNAPVNWNEMEQQALKKQQDLLALRKTLRSNDDPLVDVLVLACDSFLFSRPDGLLSIIAGFPWFTDWGRDTMIALPGLTLCTGRPEAARSILLTFVKFLSEGMLPNLFPGLGKAPVYNSVDAPLWFFFTAHKYTEYTQDHNFILSHVYPALSSIVHHYRHGTRFGIKMDAKDALISAGQEGHALTWMDAKAGDWVVTPRRGKPVEIQALWYNALKVLEELSERAGDTAQRDDCRGLAQQVRESFSEKFWNEELGCLYDVVDVDGVKGQKDASIRPNQVFALSLANELIAPDEAMTALATIKQHLLTPYGLRSLSSQDTRGDLWTRDSAYHEGTVWSWLIGHYVDALFRIKGNSESTLREGLDAISGLKAHVMSEAALGTCTEVFDGDEPHLPRACLSQAWSVAELLRVITEYGLN